MTVQGKKERVRSIAAERAKVHIGEHQQRQHLFWVWAKPYPGEYLPDAKIVYEVITPGSQHVPSVNGSHVLAGGSHLIQVKMADNPMAMFITTMTTQIPSLT